MCTGCFGEDVYNIMGLRSAMLHSDVVVIEEEHVIAISDI